MHRDWDGMVGQRRFLLDRCRTQGADWALMLDADEWPDASLWSAVAKLMEKDPPKTVGAVLHRQLMFHEKALDYVCQPERRLRLVRPEHASVMGSCGDQAEGIHDRIQVEGETVRLPGKLMGCLQYSDIEGSLRLLSSWSLETRHSTELQQCVSGDGSFV